MSATPPTPSIRPRVVTVALWCWLVADILVAAFGLLLVGSPAPTFYRVAGGLLVVVGVAHGFLVGRARRRDKRFAYAAVALALATVACLAVLLLFLVGIVGVTIVAAVMILMITGAALIQGKPAQAWFDSEEQS